MIQAGDPRTKTTKDSSFKSSAQIPAEIRPELFHKKGVLAAAEKVMPPIRQGPQVIASFTWYREEFLLISVLTQRKHTG